MNPYLLLTQRIFNKLLEKFIKLVWLSYFDPRGIMIFTSKFLISNKRKHLYSICWVTSYHCVSSFYFSCLYSSELPCDSIREKQTVAADNNIFLFLYVEFWWKRRIKGHHRSHRRFRCQILYRKWCILAESREQSLIKAYWFHSAACLIKASVGNLCLVMQILDAWKFDLLVLYALHFLENLCRLLNEGWGMIGFWFVPAQHDGSATEAWQRADRWVGIHSQQPADLYVLCALVISLRNQ